MKRTGLPVSLLNEKSKVGTDIRVIILTHLMMLLTYVFSTQKFILLKLRAFRAHLVQSLSARESIYQLVIFRCDASRCIFIQHLVFNFAGVG